MATLSDDIQIEVRLFGPNGLEIWWGWPNVEARNWALRGYGKLNLMLCSNKPLVSHKLQLKNIQPNTLSLSQPFNQFHSLPPIHLALTIHDWHLIKLNPTPIHHPSNLPQSTLESSPSIHEMNHPNRYKPLSSTKFQSAIDHKLCF